MFWFIPEQEVVIYMVEFLIEGKGEYSIKLSGLPKSSSELSLLLYSFKGCALVLLKEEKIQFNFPLNALKYIYFCQLSFSNMLQPGGATDSREESRQLLGSCSQEGT